MDKYQLLRLRKQLTIYEAASLISGGNGGENEAESLIMEAIEAGELQPEHLVRWVVTDYYNGDYESSINQMSTTIRREDLDTWLHNQGISIFAGTDAKANRETADMAQKYLTQESEKTASAPAMAWNESRKLELLARHEQLKRDKHPAPTKTLAKENAVSETAIRTRLSEARKLRPADSPIATPATPWDALRAK